MNPLTNVKNINKLNEIELEKGLVDKKSWHDMYKESAWIFVGGLAYGLTEGDILCVFSQYGEIVNINLIRDNKTGKTKGFSFLCYANQKSTVLAVDNLNGIKLSGRTIRVDHVANYKPPKENEQDDEITKQLKSEGCAPKPIKGEICSEPEEMPERKKIKKEKKKHKKKKKSGKEKKHALEKVMKVEKNDSGYDKYEFPEQFSKQRESRNESANSETSLNSNSDSDCESLKGRDKSVNAAKDKRIQKNTDGKYDEYSQNKSSKHNKRYIDEKNKRKRSESSSCDSHHPSINQKQSHSSEHFNGSSSRNAFSTVSKQDKFSSRRKNSDLSSDEQSEKHKKKKGNMCYDSGTSHKSKFSSGNKISDRRRRDSPSSSENGASHRPSMNTSDNQKGTHDINYSRQQEIENVSYKCHKSSEHHRSKDTEYRGKHYNNESKYSERDKYHDHKRSHEKKSAVDRNERRER